MPHHVVVDGSNLATEGRERPSLRQLNEAVLAYMQEDPDALITVVVDATFGHRIDPKEVGEFDEAVNNNELVAPPAGAIGRGDAFVLSIANKVNAIILTNDSYQEFHAEYPWLFDEGRLVGGKPVPHIGWVFVKRLPVRGPISRKVTAQAKKRPARGASSVAANLPMPVPTTPPPGPAVPAKRPAKMAPTKVVGAPDAVPVATSAPAAASRPDTGRPDPAKGGPLNELLPFLTFVEQHPLGSSISASVHHYSSHGAYVEIGDVMGYVPLRLMADPAPRSAREFMKLGDTVELVVEGFFAEKRSIDLAFPAMRTAPGVVPAPAKPRRAAKKAAAVAEPSPEVPAATETPAAVPAKRAAKKAAPAAPASVTAEAPAAAPKKSAAKKAAAATTEAPAAPEAPATSTATKKEVVKKAAVGPKASVKKSAAKKTAPPKTAPAKAAPAKAAPAPKGDGAAPAPAKRTAKKVATPPVDTAVAAEPAPRRGRSAS